MSEPLFIFIQFEFPWDLGPADGRYLLRAGETGAPERVVVLGTLGASRLIDAGARRPPGALSRLAARGSRPASPEPAAVRTTRATIIDPVSLPAESQARAWLEELDREHAVAGAAGVLNRVLHSHRIAAANPRVHEIEPSQALVIRAGWGIGEQVADGAWLHAREIPWSAAARRKGGRRRDRSSALRPQERLAALLGGRSSMLFCEEFTLRARNDLDAGRTAHAALELDRAYTYALEELAAEQRQDLAIRLAELEQLREQVQEQAAIALGDPSANDEDSIAHALTRLESMLRARTAVGFNLS